MYNLTLKYFVYLNRPCFLQVQVYGDVSSLYGKKENVIFICNHQSTGLLTRSLIENSSVFP